MSRTYSLSAGQKLGLCIALYLIAKPVFNFLVLGGSLKPIAVGLAALVVLYFGIRYCNTALAIVLMTVACVNLPQNLRQIGLNQYLIYTAEGMLDMAAAVMLAFHPAIRKHCGQKVING